jgi:hypothetical protein
MSWSGNGLRSRECSEKLRNSDLGFRICEISNPQLEIMTIVFNQGIIPVNRWIAYKGRLTSQSSFLKSDMEVLTGKVTGYF